ncbi:CvpA family protein [Aliishimia ponticola]|uniref:CvpA family protein n=1 Tax=Aliishimia ponticola TaxID=2499833 RepID=A0A4S4NGY0_9RHOB|nr:CvpA family protein [Aliishimia ponticola]THH38889.1 CvpA family protein [Aliishimia ponticola]
MEGFTIIDGVVALIIVLSALLAYGRGLVRELMAIAGWVIAAILGYMFAPQVEPLMSETPVIGEFIAGNCTLGMVLAFFAVMVVALIVVSLFTPLFSSLIQRSALGTIDQGLGFLFGVIRGILLIAIAFFVYDTVIIGQEFTIVDESRSAAVFQQFTGRIAEQNPEGLLEWFQLKYSDLLSSCE